MNQESIQPHHLTRQAYIYLRQSTAGQVKYNQESTQRQYALQNKAQQMGWSPTIIKVLDGDLGISGAQNTNREDFKTLVADVSMGKVGAVFALEASRLSRSCTDWHRLLELCALTNTLIIDEDGCYNPSDFNDQLLLGLKGTMSQAELHFIRSRLQGGKTNKAKKGELKIPLPVGFYYDEENHVRFDADEQVRSTLQLFFKVFKEKGSAYGVVHYFGKNNIQFPKRVYGGIWEGQLIWGRLNYSRASDILKNPAYAGAYVYGRYNYQKKLSETGHLTQKAIALPMEAWPVMIINHHEGYISWEEYLENCKIMKHNLTNKEANILPLNAREGLALLQGLLICGFCGHRLTTRYQGNGGIYPCYSCIWKKIEGIDPRTCLSVNATVLDQAVSKKVIKIITPAQVKIAIKAFEELEIRNKSLEKQWLMKIERAKYEEKLAQKRYEEVDPSNRLVAATLEKNWDEALTILERTHLQYIEYQKKTIPTSTQEQKASILSLAEDFPRLWNASSTSARDRKRILRLLIKDITVKHFKEEHKVILYIRWQGGAVEELEVMIPLPTHVKWKHSDEIVHRVRELSQTMTDSQIAEKFSQEGLKTNKGNPFTLQRIRWVRFKYKISAPILHEPEEFSINQVAEKFNVSKYVVQYWIERGIVNARRVGSRIWVFLNATKEAELKMKIKGSTKVTITRSTYQNVAAGGAV